MSRRVIVSDPSSAIVSGFTSTLFTLTKDEVDANVATAKKFVGRTAEALHRLQSEAVSAGQVQGYEDGFQQGRLDGIAAIEAELRAATNDFISTLQAKSDQVFFAVRQWLEHSENELSELSVAVAAKVLAQEIQLPHDTVTELAKQAIADLLHAERIRIRLNPFDAPALRARKEEILQCARQLREVEIVEDPTIEGGCIIESDAGLIDATIRTKLNNILDTFREAA